MPDQKSLNYADAGVSFDAEAEAMQRIKTLVRKTYRPEVLSDLGTFGGLFALSEYRQPILVSSTDSVGTKLMVAFKANKHDTVGYDIVAHCGNDIVVQGAEPLFFLDYIGIGKMDPIVVEQIVSGLADGCIDIGCALISGETAELSGLYAPDEYDLVGTIVGVVEREQVITGEKITPGDKIIGLMSNGLHTNGYTLARHILFDHCKYKIDTYLPDLSTTVGEELLKPHQSYVKPILQLMQVCDVKGIAHITGGGLPANISRVLPDGCQARIDKKSWEIQPIFSLLQQAGNVVENEMYRVFNMGIGMVLVLEQENVDFAINTLRDLDVSSKQIGEIVQGTKGVEICQPHS